MQVRHINDASAAAQVDDLLKNKKHVFVLVYMDGCGPCNATRPEWSKLDTALRSHAALANNPDVVVLEVNKEFLPNIRGIGQVDGFPTLRYFTNRGATVEEYEDAAIPRNKDRTAEAFLKWIEGKITPSSSFSSSSSPTTSKQQHSNLYKRLRRAPTPGVALRSSSSPHRSRSRTRRRSRARTGGRRRRTRRQNGSKRRK